MENFHSFANPQACAEAVANTISEKLQQAQAERSLASLVLSGGATPIPMLQRLRHAPVNWQKLFVTLADERWVDTKDSLSNERLIREYFLPASCHFIPLKNAASTAQEGHYKTDAALTQCPQPFDVTVLGMGADGHTASLFPNHPSLSEALDMKNPHHCMAIENAPKAPSQRITLTAATLLRSRQIILHITGADKRATLKRVMEDNDPQRYPVAKILHQRAVPVSIYWAE